MRTISVRQFHILALHKSGDKPSKEGRMLTDLVLKSINLEMLEAWTQKPWWASACWTAGLVLMAWAALMFYDVLTAWWTWLVLIPLVLVYVVMLAIDLLLVDENNLLTNRRRIP